MASPTTFPGDVVIPGTAYVGGIVANPGAGAYITNTLISASAAIDSTKLVMERQYVETLANHGTTPAAVRKTIGICRRTTGTIVGVRAGLVTVLASGTITVDVYKNGTTILTGTITLNSSAGTGGTAYDKVAGTLSVTTLAAGDVLEVVGTVSTPSGGGGWFVEVVTRET